ncbi:MAG: prolyl oligopeptidase family serine peptidase [Phycisphaerae bacterium]|nr:prolyl oligopeptidase family serine peptidase [Phycisphaerae bacterium]
MPDRPELRSSLPLSLAAKARWIKLAGVPALIVHPDWDPAADAPLPVRPWLLWMHGRTVTKELDPGRYQRLARAGIASVAVDLPGHGERLDNSAQRLDATLPLIAGMVSEVDAIVAAAHELGGNAGLDLERMAIGGMSAGGMATLARLCRPHRFAAAVVECATGSWRWQSNLMQGDPALVASLNPIDHLDGWRAIPLLVLHNRLDQWVRLAGQEEFVAALSARTARADLISMHVYDETGAPFEHAGFGRMGADAKDRVAQFLARHLTIQ